jgi:hypothetical protein
MRTETEIPESAGGGIGALAVASSDLPKVPSAPADPRRKAGERPPLRLPPEITAAT